MIGAAAADTQPLTQIDPWYRSGGEFVATAGLSIANTQYVWTLHRTFEAMGLIDYDITGP